MNNLDSQLKLQAFLDGELSVREATQMRELLARDQEAQALVTELRNTTSALAGNETVRELPESREFFWSKIEREIERQAAQQERHVSAPSWVEWVRRHVLPVAGVALIMGLLGYVAVFRGDVKLHLAEMELASDDMGSYTYRDQASKMTMVWFYDRDNNSDATTPAATDVSDHSPSAMPE